MGIRNYLVAGSIACLAAGALVASFDSETSENLDFLTNVKNRRIRS